MALCPDALFAVTPKSAVVASLCFLALASAVLCLINRQAAKDRGVGALGSAYLMFVFGLLTIVFAGIASLVGQYA